jgi:osomolarity two-component system response regulator SKN7
VQNNDDAFTNQQTELLQAQLMASQQEVANLSNKFHDLAQGHVVLLQHVVSLQKGLKTHDGVMHKLLGFLQSTDAERRKGQVGGRFANGSSSGLAADPTAIVEDHLASPLQQASELLEGFSTANLPDKTLEAMTNDIGYLRNDYSTPPNEHGSAHLLPQSDASSNHLTYTIGSDLDSMVYPVGHTNGIDPVNAEHIHNIPYSLPPQMPENIVSETASETRKFAGRKKTDDDVHLQIWGINKPRVLLVEDDMLCARIGSKFLQNFECGVEIAVSL